MQSNGLGNSFPSRDEIVAYLNDTIDQHNLRRFFRTHCECIAAMWQPETAKWHLILHDSVKQSDFEDVVDVLMIGWGFLTK